MTISTHVLDAVAGLRQGMSLRLERADGARSAPWQTNADGRCPELTEGLELTRGIYRLRFDTGAWFAAPGHGHLLPHRGGLAFEVTDAAAHYHVPLLLSPFAYSTYRGS